MLMADPACRDYDLSSLRVVFTGGEALPYRPAAEFEELTGAKILQFYGSNETGLLSATTVDDSRERRLRTGGPDRARDAGPAVRRGPATSPRSGRGQPACRGPATSLGYLGGTDHDKLFTRDGWMRMGDICEIDADGYLSVTGRTSDFILRGGKNISAVQVEDAVDDPSRDRGGGGGRHARSGVRRKGLRLRRTRRLRTPSTCPTSSNTCWRRGFPRNCCPNDSSCSTSCRDRPAARSPKAGCARIFGARMEAGHERS